MSDADDRKRPSTGQTRKGSGPAKPPEDDAVSDGTQEQRECMPCHGSGKVISNLGGHARTVTCPWCRGGGIRLTGVDAQEWQQEQAASKRH